jgi:hypothetical protein
MPEAYNITQTDGLPSSEDEETRETSSAAAAANGWYARGQNEAALETKET